jgi:hypothetical protein
VSKISPWLKGLAILAALAALAACGGPQPPPETELSFETIEPADRYGNLMEAYEGQEPLVVLITRPQEIDRLEGLIRHETLDQLAEVDFGRYFVVAVLRGYMLTSGHPVIVERVTRQDDRLVIYVQFWETAPYYAVAESVTTPYHLIKVERDGEVSQKTETLLQGRPVTPTLDFQDRTSPKAAMRDQRHNRQIRRGESNAPDGNQAFGEACFGGTPKH